MDVSPSCVAMLSTLLRNLRNLCSLFVKWSIILITTSDYEMLQSPNIYFEMYSNCRLQKLTSIFKY